MYSDHDLPYEVELKGADGKEVIRGTETFLLHYLQTLEPGILISICKANGVSDSQFHQSTKIKELLLHANRTHQPPCMCTASIFKKMVGMLSIIETAVCKSVKLQNETFFKAPFERYTLSSGVSGLFGINGALHPLFKEGPDFSILHRWNPILTDTFHDERTARSFTIPILRKRLTSGWYYRFGYELFTDICWMCDTEIQYQRETGGVCTDIKLIWDLVESYWKTEFREELGSFSMCRKPKLETIKLSKSRCGATSLKQQFDFWPKKRATTQFIEHDITQPVSSPRSWYIQHGIQTMYKMSTITAGGVGVVIPPDRRPMIHLI